VEAADPVRRVPAAAPHHLRLRSRQPGQGPPGQPPEDHREGHGPRRRRRAVRGAVRGPGPLRPGRRDDPRRDGPALARLPPRRPTGHPPARPGGRAVAGEPAGGGPMNVRADVAELLRAGYGDRTIARRLGVTQRSVTEARAALGLPKARGGYKSAASAEDLYWRRAQPLDDGHYQWRGGHNSSGVPVLSWRKQPITARRVAYRIANGHDPVGYVYPVCD